MHFVFWEVYSYLNADNDCAGERKDERKKLSPH